MSHFFRLFLLLSFRRPPARTWVLRAMAAVSAPCCLWLAFALYAPSTALGGPRPALIPKLLYHPDVRYYYPDQARRYGQSGTVVIGFSIGESGRTALETISGGSNAENALLAAAALKLVERLRLQHSVHTREHLVATIVFQLDACKATPLPDGSDYVFDICARSPGCPASVNSPLKPLILSILQHADLSDLRDLNSRLHLGFKLGPDTATLPGETQRTGVATAASEYAFVEETGYSARFNLKAATTTIQLRFSPKMPVSPCAWGAEWNQPHSGEDGMATDGGPPYHVEQMRWDGGNYGAIRLATMSGPAQGTEVTLSQTIPHLISFPDDVLRSPDIKPDLVQRIVDVLLMPDLRDSEQLSQLLRTRLMLIGDVTDWGFISAQILKPIPETDSADFRYIENDIGWDHRYLYGGLGCCPTPAPTARVVEMSFAVDTGAVCFSDDDIAHELATRGIHFGEKRWESASTFDLVGHFAIRLKAFHSHSHSCVTELSFRQISEVDSSFSVDTLSLTFNVQDLAGAGGMSLSTSGQQKVRDLGWRVANRGGCGVTLIPADQPLPSGKLKIAPGQLLADLVKKALIVRGIPGSAISVSSLELDRVPLYYSRGDTVSMYVADNCAK
jgi:TonB family protein